MALVPVLMFMIVMTSILLFLTITFLLLYLLYSYVLEQYSTYLTSAMYLSNYLTLDTNIRTHTCKICTLHMLVSVFIICPFSHISPPFSYRKCRTETDIAVFNIEKYTAI